MIRNVTGDNEPAATIVTASLAVQREIDVFYKSAIQDVSLTNAQTLIYTWL